jgi:hypothetical protein
VLLSFERSPESSRVEDIGNLFITRIARQNAIAKADRKNRFARKKLQEKQQKQSRELWIKRSKDMNDLSLLGTDFKRFVGF